MKNESIVDVKGKYLTEQIDPNDSLAQHFSPKKKKYLVIGIGVTFYTLLLSVGLIYSPFLQQMSVDLVDYYYRTEFVVSNMFQKETNVITPIFPHPSQKPTVVTPTFAQIQEPEIENKTFHFISPSGSTDIDFSLQDISKEKEYLGIIYGVEEATFSPDESKLLLIANGGTSIPLLMYTQVDSKDFNLLGGAVIAKWSHDSRYIAYTTKHADAGPVTDVYVFNTETNEQVPVDLRPEIENLDYWYLNYLEIEWLKDDSGVRAHYHALGLDPNNADLYAEYFGSVIGEGYVVLPLEMEE